MNHTHRSRALRRAADSGRATGFWLLLFSLVGAPSTGFTENVDCSAEARTRALLERMDDRINSEEGAAGLNDYLDLFSPEVNAWGLYPDGAADIKRVREHYQPVFGNFKDSVLVSEELIIAGDMAAQRYHALFRLSGVFDGVAATDRLTAIRGQTFFRFDENGLIAERWSNHDHAYRMSQLLGESGREKGAALALELNGPPPREAEVLAAINRLKNAFNHIEDPELRRQQVMGLLAPNLVDRNRIIRGLEAFWLAVPDATLAIDSSLSAWSMAALGWRISGSLRDDFKTHKATGRPVHLTGNTIIKFNSDSQIQKLWQGCVRWSDEI